jgi:hypothetical protein
MQPKQIQARSQRIQALFAACVEQAGGRWIDQPAKQGDREQKQSTADFLFEQEGVIGEMKCLMADPERERPSVGKLVNGWTRDGLMRSPGVGRIKIDGRWLPPELQGPFFQAMARSVQDVVKDAHDQIKATKLARNLPDARGLLVLVIDRDFTFQPLALAKIVLDVTGSTTKNSSIDELVIVGSPYVPIASPGAPEGAFFWAHCLVGRRRVDHGVLDRLSEAWNVVNARRVGGGLRVLRQTGDPESLLSQCTIVKEGWARSEEEAASRRSAAAAGFRPGMGAQAFTRCVAHYGPSPLSPNVILCSLDGPLPDRSVPRVELSAWKREDGKIQVHWEPDLRTYGLWPFGIRDFLERLCAADVINREQVDPRLRTPAA